MSKELKKLRNRYDALARNENSKDSKPYAKQREEIKSQAEFEIFRGTITEEEAAELEKQYINNGKLRESKIDKLFA